MIKVSLSLTNDDDGTTYAYMITRVMYVVIGCDGPNRNREKNFNMADHCFSKPEVVISQS